MMGDATARHLSIRVPWHDRGWDGSICDDPKGNSACLALSRIAELRDDNLEASVAGAALETLEPRLQPPCLAERATFLSGKPYTLRVTMPYSTWSPHHAHIEQQSISLPAWSGLMVPYRWMLKEPAEEIARDFGLDLEREPDETFPRFMVDTPWIQNVANQQVMLEGFADQLQEERSLVFFYAKQTPLSDSGGIPIVAVAALEHVGRVDEYPYSGGSAKGRVQSMVWERPFQHSLRRDELGLSGGVVLPYQEVLALARADGSIDPASCLAFAPADARDQFLYGSEHVSHGGALAALQSVRKALENVALLMPGPWDQMTAWLDTRINAIWQMRGPAPGLGSALSCLDGTFNGTLFAHALAGQLKDGADPWPHVIDIFENNRPTPFSGPQITTLQRKRFALLREKQPERFDLLQLLSRFELSKAQALSAFESGPAAELVQNPYRLFEGSRFTPEPIPFGTIDQGLYSGGAIRQAFPLPAGTKLNIEEPDHPLRLRAVAVELLERAAVGGDTLASGARLAEAAASLPLSTPAPLDSTVLELCEDEFAPEIVIERIGDEPFAQLTRYEEAGTLIRAHASARLQSTPAPVAVDWAAALDSRLPAMAQGDSVEVAARAEKAAALHVLAGQRVAILTGPAGSGKTTLLQLLLDRQDVVGRDLLLLAPTGKARVRLGQQTKRAAQAQTLAQFLRQQERWDPETGAYSFEETGGTAAVSTCVVDEASMLTEDQLAALLSAIPKGARLILVGDPYQLPPIGAGRPFVDLIAHLVAEHGGAGIARLTISRRQGADAIVRAGELEDVQLANLFSGAAPGPGEDEIAGRLARGDTIDRVRLVEWSGGSDLRERLADVLAEELGCTDGDLERAVEQSLGGTGDGALYFNAGSGEAAENWQILTVHRDLPNGSGDLNRHIKRIARNRRLGAARSPGHGWKMIEPRGPDQITYGDKVICLANHKRKRWNPTEERQNGYLANGEVGIVIGETSSKHWPSRTTVEFATQAGERYSFFASDFSDHSSPLLELGYAITVHKAQGSEFAAVILVLPATSRLLSRELLYTALTRQKRRIWILHQGAFGSLLRLRSEYYSETARRLTNLFREADLAPVPAPDEAPVSDGPRFLEQYLVHKTRRGDLVRSKSEIVIADALFQLEQEGKLRYTYEKPLMLADTQRWPDFTIEAGTETWYWEHCGLLDDPDYESRWKRKHAAYAREGIAEWSEACPAGRLIVTADGKRQGLDSDRIHEIARAICGDRM
jgi:hypothetical protein